MAKQSINISFPFKETIDGGIFKTNNTSNAALTSNLIALLTLRKGQRPMSGNMGSPIYDFIMEPLDSSLESELEDEIKITVKQFLPQIDIKKITFTQKPDENLLGIKIIFIATDLFDILQSVEINIPFDEVDQNLK